MFLKVATLIVWGLVAIITSATALNAGPGAFLSAIAVLNLAVNGVAIYKAAKNVAEYLKSV